MIVRSEPELSEISKPRALGNVAFIDVDQVDNGLLQDCEPKALSIDHGGGL